MEGILTEAAGILKEDVWRKEVSCGIEPFHLQLIWGASSYVESLLQVELNQAAGAAARLARSPDQRRRSP